MSSKKNQELRALSDEELSNELKETRLSYENMNFDHAVRGLDNPNVLRNVRRDVARIETEVNRRKLQA